MKKTKNLSGFPAELNSLHDIESFLLELNIKLRELLSFRVPTEVTEYRVIPLCSSSCFEVCPRCGSTLKSTYQSCCDSCGQKLKWINKKKMILNNSLDPKKHTIK